MSTDPSGVQAASWCPDSCVYATHMRGGTPISVRICMVCRQIDFDDLTAQAVALTTPSSAVPYPLQGDGPCMDCGTGHNIRWFTDSTLWNEVLSFPEQPSRDDPGGILCIPCFVRRVDAASLWPRSWRLLPEWHWETKAERAQRLRFPDAQNPEWRQKVWETKLSPGNGDASPTHVGPCCYLHGVHCEPMADLCCESCTEARHPEHAPGTACVLTIQDVIDVSIAQAAEMRRSMRFPADQLICVEIPDWAQGHVDDGVRATLREQHVVIVERPEVTEP